MLLVVGCRLPLLKEIILLWMLGGFTFFFGDDSDKRCWLKESINGGNSLGGEIQDIW